MSSTSPTDCNQPPPSRTHALPLKPTQHGSNGRPNENHRRDIMVAPLRSTRTVRRIENRSPPDLSWPISGPGCTTAVARLPSSHTAPPRPFPPYPTAHHNHRLGAEAGQRRDTGHPSRDLSQPTSTVPSRCHCTEASGSVRGEEAAEVAGGGVH